jgi:hypothetical protein
MSKIEQAVLNEKFSTGIRAGGRVESVREYNNRQAMNFYAIAIFSKTLGSQTLLIPKRGRQPKLSFNQEIVLKNPSLLTLPKEGTSTSQDDNGRTVKEKFSYIERYIFASGIDIKEGN